MKIARNLITIFYIQPLYERRTYGSEQQTRYNLSGKYHDEVYYVNKKETLANYQSYL